MNRERKTDRQIDKLLPGKDAENSGPEPETDNMGVSGERFRGPHGDSFLKAEEGSQQKPVAGLSDSQAGGGGNGVRNRKCGHQYRL